MIIELLSAAILIGSFIYHRLTQSEPKGERGAIDAPTVEEGTPIPQIFGRCRVTTPILAWGGPVTFEMRAANVYDMRMNQFFVLGRGFEHGDGLTTPIASNGVGAMYVGDQKCADGNVITGNPVLEDLTGNGNNETPSFVSLVRSDSTVIGNAEFLNGGPAQQLVNSGAKTYSASMMKSSSPLGSSLAESVIPGYRGVLGVCLFQTPLGFNHGRVNGLPAYHFEAWSYGTNHPQLGTYARVGVDSNPVNVIFAILTAPHLLGLPESIIDIPNFQAAQYTLMTETHGYSRFWNQRTSAAEMLNDVLRQIDGMLYFEQRTAKIRIKLIRADFSVPDIFQIDRSNCEKLVGFSMGGRTNLINKVRVTYLDRDANYEQKSATAQNMANAVGQDGQVAEEVIDYPGCCSAATAKALAERELAARSRPVVKCRASGVSRAALRLNPGDPVLLVWSNPDVNATFRVMKVERGTHESGGIALDLLLDANYVWRRQAPRPPDFGGLEPPNPPVVIAP